MLYMKTIFTQYFSLIFITLISFCSTEILNCQEICNDGLDNNNNGFVDGFDSECPCFDNTYFNICQPDCQIDFTPEPITISQNWSSNAAVITMSTLITGDINNDGTPEIITLGTTGMTTNNPRVSSGINVFDGLTGNLLSSFSSPFAYWETPGSLLIADVNNDGFSEIILASSVAGNSLNNQRYIYCYSFNGNFQWKSNVQYGANTPGNNKGGGSLGIADFNYDGIPEVYIFNEIFNAQTGVKLVDGGNNGIGRMETTLNSLQNGVYSLTVAGDLTTNFGLELVAGKTVYNVIISNLNGTTGNSMFPINNNLNRDGFTSIADINLDGNLDVIVSCSGNLSNSLLYVWNPLTNSIISSVNLPTGNNLDLSGVAFIGDMDGDGAPEIGVCRPLKLFTYKFQNNNLVLKWSLTTSDISGATKISMFDFNQDGLQEIVYRDETQLRIFNGSGNTPQLITSFPSFSGTAFEGPIISDVNNDNQSNILITSDDASLGPHRGRIQCLKSNGQPWAPSRKIWNQYAYFNVNINNDLTVPIQQQNHGLQFYNTLGSCLGATLRPLNSFMAQETIRDITGCPIYPAPDLIISQVDNIVYDCSNQIISIDLTINNQGSTTIFTEFNLMIFEGNNAVPGNFVHNQLVNISLAPLAQTTITVNLTDFSLSTIFALLNFNNLNQNFPYNTVNECNYSNNFFNFSLLTPEIIPTFTQVVPICSGATLSALPTNSTNGISGTWSPAINNTSTTTYTFTPSAGQCATNQIMSITIDPSTTTGSVTTTICEGSSYTWPANGQTYTTAQNGITFVTGCNTATLNITITPNNTPTFAAVGPYCTGEAIADLSLTSTNGISGTWSPVIDNTATTTYTFTPTSTATPICASTVAATISINTNTIPIFDPVGPYCSGAIIPDLPLTSANGITGTWSPAINNTATTTYTFTPTSTATPTCATTAALTITINPTPTVSFIPGATIGCLPFETSLTNTTPNAQNCVWTISNGIVLTGCGSIPVIFSNDGCFDVTLTTTVSNGCTSSLTMNNLICVENNPIASFSSSTNDLSILNTEVLFDNTSTGANTYQWYFGVNDAESSLEDPIFTFPNDYENGQYEVILIAISTIGCKDTAETIIQINEELLFYIPNTFTPDGDVYNQTFKPVFTSGFDPYHYEMLIYNRWGEIIFETHDVTYGWDGKYALKNCQEGIYSYKITFKNPILDERKVVCGSINLLK